MQKEKEMKVKPKNRTCPGFSGRRRFLKSTVALAGVMLTSRRLFASAMAYPPVRAVTHGPLNHFFGYYDKCPWDATGQYLLASQIGFFDRNPKPGEKLTVGMIDLENDNKYIPFDRTLAWSWQQGTMLQPVGTSSEVIYNNVDGDHYVALVRDIKTGKLRKLPRPIYAISRDGTQAVTLDYERVNRLRPGYGYIALPEPDKDNPAPPNKGIYWMDLKTGENKLVLSLEWASQHEADDRFKDGEHWFNHLLFNPSGSRFIFLHRWRTPKRRSWFTRLYTANADGTGVRLLSDINMVSHFDWRDDHTIIAWTRTKEKGDHFYHIDDRTGEHTVVGEGVLTTDGHCSYSPDRKWVLNDTYPDKEHKQTLMLYRPADNKRIDIGRFLQPERIHHKPYRCDLHPRWNRDGTQVCIDSTHENSRQMYVIEVGSITKGKASS